MKSNEYVIRSQHAGYNTYVVAQEVEYPWYTEHLHNATIFNLGGARSMVDVLTDIDHNSFMIVSVQTKKVAIVELPAN